MEYKHVELKNHPKNEEGVFKSLIEKYNKFGTLYIGVDFDNTLKPYGVDEKDAEEGFADILHLLQRAKALGMKLCLWTLPESQENLNWKFEWCTEHGIDMDYINESPLLNEYSSKYRKPHFNLLLDDTAGLDSSYSILYNVVEYISKQKK